MRPDDTFDELDDDEYDFEPTIEDRARFLLNALARNERLKELTEENSFIHRSDQEIARRHLARLQAMLDQIRADLGEDPEIAVEMARIRAQVEQDLDNERDGEGNDLGW